ncbi:MAG TPA: hypothetical protein DCR31_01675 [Ruminococcaceae bacterium]|nr:hypothetical protein [Oscillospiraceae bacterium]
MNISGIFSGILAYCAPVFVQFSAKTASLVSIGDGVFRRKTILEVTVDSLGNGGTYILKERL